MIHAVANSFDETDQNSTRILPSVFEFIALSYEDPRRKTPKYHGSNRPGWREVLATDDYDGSPPSACVRSTVQPMDFWFTGTAFAQMEQTGYSLGACR